MTSSRFNRVLRCDRSTPWFLTLLAVLWLLAASVRLFFRDVTSWTLLDVVHYATPGPLLMLGAFGIACLCALFARPRQAIGWCLMAAVVAQCSGSAPMRDVPGVRPAPETNPTEQPIRLLFWNTAHLKHGLDAIAADIQTYDADVVALVESGPASERYRGLWQERFPDYNITLFGAEMMLLVRDGYSMDADARQLAGLSRLRSATVEVADQSFRLMLVDIAGRPDIDRQPHLEQLAAEVQQNQSQSIIIAGDFNTPRDSFLFQPLEGLVRNAFDEVGEGYAPTWPVPFPVLTLDQIWGNRGVAFRSCQHDWSKRSDHRPVLVEFQVVP